MGLSGPPEQASFPIGLAPAWCRGATARIARRRRDLIATRSRWTLIGAADSADERLVRAHSRELEPQGWLVGAGRRPQCQAVESIPGKVNGAWVFKGTRLPVATVIQNLEDLSIDEVIEQFDVTREQIEAVLEFVAKSLRSYVPTGARPL
ncbi:MAG TPA: DUF433 domain-containing protein [Vicinamibacterales bacterium]|jgi:uncharacterized protein (DUF433 family)|nr:DUF433 domain-containing protein [Vicinamibacterales bacterium]